jgi:UDP-N-acetylmuramoylalanine--D-glutamate ligase
MIELTVYNKIVVLGAGESGCGAAVLAARRGYRVLVSDSGKVKNQYKELLTAHGIDFEEMAHSSSVFDHTDLVIKSPGIPDETDIVRKFRYLQVPVISEIEFASWFTDAKMICVTGSNGKTTTTLLLGYILQQAGLNVSVAGNVGSSFAYQVATQHPEFYVLELSSFQLDGMFRFKADIAIIMNITPDHLDRYGNDFNKYAESKYRIVQNMDESGALIYCLDDPTTRELIARHQPKCKLYPFTLNGLEQSDGAGIENDEIIIQTNNTRIHMTLEELALQGKHNAYNSMAAGVAAKLLQIRKETIKQSLSDFQNIAHRLEFVANVHGVTYINDSKATNVNSAWYAIESMERPVVWIAGGVDKGNDYEMLKPLVKKKVKALICLGTANERLIQAFGGIVPVVVEARSAEEAVFAASNLSTNNDVVLLSPACASFDLFENYEDRGNKFKEAVKRL